MDNSKLFERYFTIADYIAAINGEKCEVIVHDLSNLEKSIIHIVNGHITNRKVGGTITNFAIDLISQNQYKDSPSIDNYIGTIQGKKVLRSSTYFIKDDFGKTIGLLCVNIDISHILQAKDIIDDLLMIDQLTKQNIQIESKESFNLSVDEVMDNIINSAILKFGISLADSNMEQKKELTRKLDELGIFKFKGAVNKVAKLMQTSNQTVYRYIQEIQNKSSFK